MKNVFFLYFLAIFNQNFFNMRKLIKRHQCSNQKATGLSQILVFKSDFADISKPYISDTFLNNKTQLFASVTLQFRDCS